MKEKAESVLRESGEILSVSVFLGASCFSFLFPSIYKVLMNYFLKRGVGEWGK